MPRVPGYGLCLIPLITAGCAAGDVAVATAATQVLPFALFAIAVASTVIYAGRGPGTVAVVLSVLASDFLFLEPQRTLTLGAFTVALLAAYTIPVAVAGRRPLVPAASRAR